MSSKLRELNWELLVQSPKAMNSKKYAGEAELWVSLLSLPSLLEEPQAKVEKVESFLRNNIQN